MLRVAFFLITLWCAPAFAQAPTLPGFPPGVFQSRAAIDASSVYVGPGDINGTAFAFWSTRCITNAYSGNVMDVTDSATGNTLGTRLQCSSGVVSALVSGSACTFVTGNACSTLATTCATACNVRTLYDQSGQTNCTTACDATQATNASRATLTQNCQNGKICLTHAAQIFLTPALSANSAQPLTGTLVADRTGATASFKAAMGGSNANIQFGFANAINTAWLTTDAATTNLTATASDNAVHAIQTLLNGASSQLAIDGSTTTGAAGANGMATGGGNLMGVGGCPCNAFTGQWFEGGWWSGDKSANYATLNSNQHSYWNF